MTSVTRTRFRVWLDDGPDPPQVCGEFNTKRAARTCVKLNGGRIVKVTTTKAAPGSRAALEAVARAAKACRLWYDQPEPRPSREDLTLDLDAALRDLDATGWPGTERA